MLDSDEEFQRFIHPLVHESMAKTEICNEQFKIGQWPRWDYDSENSTLTFSKGGKPRVMAEVVVGTVEGDRWQWTWSNKNASETTRRLLDQVRVFGEENGWSKLSTSFLHSDEYTGWEMTSVAVHLLDGKGSYRFPTDEGFAYLVYRDIRWVV